MTDAQAAALVFCRCGKKIYPFGYHMPCNQEAYAEALRCANLGGTTSPEGSSRIEAQAERFKKAEAS